MRYPHSYRVGGSGHLEGGLDALVGHQRDVKIPLAKKLATLRRVVLDLQARGYQFVTLREAAQAFENEVRG